MSRGALVTAHKLDLLAAARDLLDGLDPLAAALHEVSCLSKVGGRLIGYAKDPVSSGLALRALLPKGHWQRTGATCFALGAGGAALAITCHLAARAHGTDRPARLVVSDCDASRLAEISATHRRLGMDLPIEYRHANDVAANDAVLLELPPCSLVINATGLGKDGPGSPLSDAALFPAEGIVWDLNYRGALSFLAQARRQATARGLRVHDGWIYFLHGWTRVIAEVFHIDIATEGPQLEALSRLAAAARG